MSQIHLPAIPVCYQHSQDKTVFHARHFGEVSRAFEYASRAVIIDEPIPEDVANAAAAASQYFGPGKRRHHEQGQTDWGMRRGFRNMGVSRTILDFSFARMESIYAAIHGEAGYEGRKRYESRSLGFTTVEPEPNWHTDHAPELENVFVQPLVGAGTRLATAAAMAAFSVSNLKQFTRNPDSAIAAEAALGPTAIEIKPGQALLLNLARGRFPPPIHRAIHAGPHDTEMGNTSPVRLALVIDIPAVLPKRDRLFPRLF